MRIIFDEAKEQGYCKNEKKRMRERDGQPLSRLAATAGGR